ncbi:multiple sugar transport system permease protein [Nonomuraea thailandensis]|uniref:Multiple sugar transport system permease protein n=1 Tax=Nonomuraea thailandensis TaxID=1188745 RepID=A0A9X2GCR3_9ACTN|nr:sugar ABC transporter permease [Nonomuraea thailandensis]MCP2355257.1 multiple sugar transport system permease protein [Nonomuraea thailandensis]
MASAAPLRSRLRRYGTSYAMLLPFLGLFAAFLIWPLANSLYLSFTTFDGINPAAFTGLDNFRDLTQDARFLHALRNTTLYVVASVLLGTLLSLGLALAFGGPGWGHRILRTVFFLPSVTSSIALMLMWKWVLFPSDVGLANTIARWFGGTAVAWLATPGLTIPILVLMSVWGGMGYGMVLYVAGLGSIPREYYEAAEIDGASAWQRFRRITLPLLRPVTTYVVVTGLIGAFQVFEAVYIVFRGTNNVGGVLDSGLMIVPYLYDQGFTHFKLGYASAIAWVLFLIIFVLSLVNLRLGRALKEL